MESSTGKKLVFRGQPQKLLDSKQLKTCPRGSRTAITDKRQGKGGRRNIFKRLGLDRGLVKGGRSEWAFEGGPVKNLLVKIRGGDQLKGTKVDEKSRSNEDRREVTKKTKMPSAGICAKRRLLTSEKSEDWI